MPAGRLPRPRLGLTVAFLSLLVLAGSSLLAPAPPAAKPSPKDSAAAGPKPLAEWRALQKEAEEAMSEPPGPHRIARCEAFLKEHPEHPSSRMMFGVLIDDLLETKTFDRNHVARLLEQWGKPKDDSHGFLPVFLVSRYYFDHDLPLDSAARLLKWGRESLARERAGLEKEPDPKAREQRVAFDPQFRLELSEGRLLLARGDAAGARRQLLEAEATAKTGGQIATLRDSGRNVAEFPTHSPDADWLNLSLSDVERRLGNRTAARARLERVRHYGRLGFQQMESALAKLRRDLSVPAPPANETRADPRQAADFTLEDLEGKRVSLSNYRGQVVLVMLWTTW
jgi:hypothetical protein